MEMTVSGGAGNVFLYGPLCHAPLLAVVLGHAATVEDASLSGHVAVWAEGQPHALLIEQAGGSSKGALLRGLSAQDAARLSFYAQRLDVDTLVVTVYTANGSAQACVHTPTPGQWQVGAAWRLDDWQASVGQMVTATAADVMALYGQAPAALVQSRHDAMLVRGAGRVRARKTAPNTVRRAAVPGDVVVASRTQAYAKFFAVEDYALRLRRFDGSLGPQIRRAAFVSADAVTVLPYDAVRDRVLLIEQFRMGPFARGDAQPWMLEPIAGRIDPGETPEQAARREAVEEAGLTLGALIEVARYYPTPGAMAEFLYSYVALCDLPDGVAGVFGAEHEAENIRGHLMPFDALMALVGSGEAAVGPLVLTAMWLERERPRLRR
jgi:ADP-ribose pyrophosphatase